MHVVFFLRKAGNPTATPLVAAIGHNWASVWVNIGCEQFVMAMYLWTVIAHVLLRDLLDVIRFASGLK
jgi:hypothetical protein